MFNQYFMQTPENADIIIANTVIENLKFIVIALDLVFQKNTNSDFYDEDYTFYFYHLQNAFTSCGNIINVFSGNLRRSQLHNERAKHLKETFNINLDEYHICSIKNSGMPMNTSMRDMIYLICWSVIIMSLERTHLQKKSMGSKFSLI